MKKEVRILLVNPEVPNTFWSLKSALKFVSKKSLLPPLGLLTVAAMLPPNFNRKLIDLNVSSLRDKDILWADFIFITGMVIQKKSADDIIERAKRLGTKIVAGGPLFSYFSDSYIKSVDHLILKEAEVTLPLFLEDLACGEPKRIYDTEEKPDLSISPVPEWDLVKMNKYSMMPIQYSRGCPFNCDFCDITALLGRKVRTKTTTQIINELERLYVHKWRGEVFFVDDNFIGKRQQLKNHLLPAIIDWMESRGRPFVFNTQASIDLVDDEELMSMLVRAGFDCVFVGIESPSDTSLSECSKNQNTGRDMVASIRKIQRFGLQVQAGFIIGFDSDKPNVFDKMINLIQESGIVTAMVGLLNAPRGTALYKKMEAQQRLTDPPSGDNMDCTMNFRPKMDMQELTNGYQKVLTTLYSPENYSKRVKIFLQNYKLSPNKRIKLKYSNIKAFFLSILRLGILEKGKRHYWMLLFWSLRYPKRFPLAVRFSIYGYHFRQLLKNVCPQIEALNDES